MLHGSRGARRLQFGVEPSLQPASLGRLQPARVLRSVGQERQCDAPRTIDGAASRMKSQRQPLKLAETPSIV